jgi:hypothetical protein
VYGWIIHCSRYTYILKHCNVETYIYDIFADYAYPSLPNVITPFAASRHPTTQRTPQQEREARFNEILSSTRIKTVY